MSLGGAYASDGSLRVTVVDGSSSVPLRNADGSLNVILSDGTRGGVYHTCGALRVTVYSSGVPSYYASDGSMYVKDSPYTIDIIKVTVITGSLSSGDTNGILLRDGSSFLLLRDATSHLLLGH